MMKICARGRRYSVDDMTTPSDEPLPADEPLPVRRMKRLFDILLALCLLLSLAPLLLLIVAVMLLEQRCARASRGPILYRENRMTHGRPFTILKFRIIRQTVIDAARVDAGGALNSIKELEHVEDNLTGYGRVLKKYYLDELPQLVNILAGHMSFVGPRPWPVEDYQRQVKRGIITRSLVPSGLTGLVQSFKGSRSDLDSLDQTYIEAYRSRSPLGFLWFDFTIMLRSVRVLWQAKGL